ncbi:hypothetical protein [Dictyobacter kobayashii]|uniref:Uncharacterized protein n=1 Tax=Dictyobacter kobayashii TaxID=2014872 RepID=A0A402AHP6_9CHLR|nr:hypothetical protein [Dictyobacter kobayashii]GCE18640.1 hypothetical protein KDK_24400 [Dictyobacter kobayashii]
MSWFGGKRKEEPAFVWQDGDATDEELGVSEISSNGWTTDCAWCLQEQGIEPSSGSHGVCAYHRDQLWQSYQVRRSSRHR